MTNALIRILFLGLPLVFLIIRGHRSSIDRYIILLIAGSFLVELLDLTGFENNNSLLLTFNIFESCLISFFMWKDTGKKLLLIIGPGVLITLTILSGFTDFTFDILFRQRPQEEMIQYQKVFQLFDLLSVNRLLIIAYTFYWLYWMVNFHEGSLTEFRKRMIYAFAFLFFSGGSFFVMAFSRLTLPDFYQWFNLWTRVIIPLFFIYHSILFFGLIWKSKT